MKLIDYRQASSKFRRLSSNMMVTTYKDGNLHLIRLKRFMDSNEIIQKIVSERINNIDFNYKENDFILVKENSYWAQLNPPIDEDKHMKAIYDYLTDMTQDEIDLTGIASKFYHESKKYTDIVRNYIDVVFKPLVDYIIGILSEEMMYLENKNDKGVGIVVNQTIGNNYGANNFTQGDITSNNYVNIGTREKDDIKSLIAEITAMIKTEAIEEDVKEDILDELDIINEQIESEAPKQTRIKKACKGIKEFISNLPSNLGKARLIVMGLTSLLESLECLETMIK